MKQCPACHRSFPDFHFVCDFDGAALVSDPERLALIKLPARRLFARRFIKSPKTVTALAILALFVAAAIIGYRQTASRSSRSLLAVNVAKPSLQIPLTESTRETLNGPPSSSVSNVATRLPTRTYRSTLVSGSLSKTRAQLRKEHASRQTEVAHRSARPPAEKQPKFVAALKTTWRLLKRPFSF